MPIEVLPSAYRLVQVTIERLHGGKAVLRQAKAKAGPCITDNGNFLIDCEFDPRLDFNWKEVNSSLMMIPGVIETGCKSLKFINLKKLNLLKLKVFCLSVYSNGKESIFRKSGRNGC